MHLNTAPKPPYQVLAGDRNTTSARPATVDQLNKLPALEQKTWWSTICAEPAVAAYLAVCKEIGDLSVKKAELEAQIKVQEIRKQAVDDFYAAAKLNNNKPAIDTAKSAVIKGCQGLLKVIQDNWVAKKMYEQGFKSYQELGYSAALYQYVKNGGAIGVVEVKRGSSQGDNFFADLPAGVFNHPLYGGGIVPFTDWFDDETTREVLKILYNDKGSGLSAGLKGGGYTRSLDPVVAGYIRQNIVAPAILLNNLWVFSSQYFLKKMTQEKADADFLIKMYKENAGGLNEVTKDIDSRKKKLPSLLSNITDALSKYIAMTQGELYIQAGELQGAQSAAVILATAAGEQAAGASVISKMAKESAGRIGTGRGTEEEMANRAGTQMAAAFAGSKRSASTKRNGEAKKANDKGREILKFIETTSKSNAGATVPVDTQVANTNANNTDKQIKDNANEVIKVGDELKGSLDKITDPSIDKSGTETLIASNKKASEEILGGGFPWLLLLAGAAALAQNK